MLRFANFHNANILHTSTSLGYPLPEALSSHCGVQPQSMARRFAVRMDMSYVEPAIVAGRRDKNKEVGN